MPLFDCSNAVCVGSKVRYARLKYQIQQSCACKVSNIKTMGQNLLGAKLMPYLEQKKFELCSAIWILYLFYVSRSSKCEDLSSHEAFPFQHWTPQPKILEKAKIIVCIKASRYLQYLEIARPNQCIPETCESENITDIHGGSWSLQRSCGSKLLHGMQIESKNSSKYGKYGPQVI